MPYRFDLAPVTGRHIDKVLGFHDLEPSLFEGKTVYDLGCGWSRLEEQLATKGILAQVVGLDANPHVVSASTDRDGKPSRVFTELPDIPMADESADIVLATYSYPFWANTAKEIDRLFQESQRVLRAQGILAIYPANVHFSEHEQDDPVEHRVETLRESIRQIEVSLDWTSVGGINKSPDSFAVQKIK